MSYTNFSEFQPSRSTAAVPGFWKLTPGSALSLQPRQAGVLRIARGRAWATLDAPHNGPGNASGDYLLRDGQELSVQAGQHVVFEPMEKGSCSAVFFEWTPFAEASMAGAGQGVSVVTQPWQELGRALAMTGTALAHLGVGLLSYAGQRLGTRQHVQTSHCTG